MVDGTHSPVQRPSEKTVRRMRYSGKKKRFTNNTNVYINKKGMIVGISEHRGLYKRHHAASGGTDVV